MRYKDVLAHIEPFHTKKIGECGLSAAEWPLHVKIKIRSSIPLEIARKTQFSFVLLFCVSGPSVLQAIGSLSLHV